jgi:acyl-CoA dehydrogenase
MIGFDLTPEQKELKQKAREFALKYILPVTAYYDEIDETPISILKAAFEEGLINGDVSEKYGGKGYGVLEGIIITEEIAAAGPGIATSVFDNSLGIEPLKLSTNETAKQKYLPKIVNDFKLMAFATSEPTMGSDVSGIRCAAKLEGNDYILNGTKYWITNGGLADYFTIFATADSKALHKGICAFLVEKDWEGVKIGKRIPKLGQRCSDTSGVHLENVRVPRENVLAEPGEGFALAMRTFAHTRPGIGAFAVGTARSAMEYAIDYAKKRHVFGSRVADFQGIQFKIADMYQKIETSRLLTYKAAWEADNEMDATIAASISKLYATEAAFEVVDEALQIFGGYGYTRMYPIEKLFRDARLFRIYEGTSEIQRMIISGYAMNSYKPVMPALEDLPMHTKDPVKVNQPGKPETTAWRCRICGYVHYGKEPPETCPYCFFPASAFKSSMPSEEDNA